MHTLGRWGRLTIATCLLGSLACSHSKCRVTRSSLGSEPYPAKVVIATDLRDTRRIALEVLDSSRRQGRDAIFPMTPEQRSQVSGWFWAVPVTDCVYWRKFGICDSPENRDDVILHNHGDASFYSKSYIRPDRELRAHALFLLHFRRIDSETTEVSISTLDGWVSNGERFGYGFGGFGMYKETEPVEPTGIEENVVARFLERAASVALARRTKPDGR